MVVSESKVMKLVIECNKMVIEYKKITDKDAIIYITSDDAKRENELCNGHFETFTKLLRALHGEFISQDVADDLWHGMDLIVVDFKVDNTWRLNYRGYSFTKDCIESAILDLDY